MTSSQELQQKAMLAWRLFEESCTEVERVIAGVRLRLEPIAEFSAMPKFTGVLAPPGYPADPKIENILAEIEFECEQLALAISRRRQALDELLELKRQLPAPDYPKDIIF
jgi:hypothetical protein